MAWDIGADEYVSGGTSVTPEPAEQTGTFSQLAAVVLLGSAVVGASIAGTFDIPAPTVSTTQSISVSTNHISAQLSLLNPTVIITSVIPLPDGAILGRFDKLPDPTVITTTSVSASPNNIDGQFSIPAPAISTEVGVSPSFISGAFSVLDPSIKIQTLTSPAELAGSLSLVDPTISAGGSITNTPNPLTGEFSLLSPTVSAIRSITAPIGNIAGSFDLLGDASISVYSLAVADAEIDGAFSLAEPTVLISATLVPVEPIEGAFSAEDPEVVVGLICQASPITGEFSIPAISFILYSPVPVSPIDGAFSLPEPSVQALNYTPDPIDGTFSVPNNPSSHISIDYRPSPIGMSASIVERALAPLELNGTFSLVAPLVITTGEGQVFMSEPEIDGSFSIASDPVSHVSQRYVPEALACGFSIAEPSISDGSIEVPVNAQSGSFSIASNPHSHVSATIVPASLEMSGSVLQSGWVFVTVTPEPIDAILSVAPYIDIELDNIFTLEEISAEFSSPEAVVLKNLNTFIHADVINLAGSCVTIGYIFVPDIVTFHICLESSICTMIELESNILTDMDLSSNILIE